MYRCNCCGSGKLKKLIDFGMQPVAHNLLDSKDEQDSFEHPLILHYCENCGFVQINNPIPPEKLYTKYNYCFSAWKKQPQIDSEIQLINRNVRDKNIKILEIGCNDGVFLKPLYHEGYKNLVGVEANPYASKCATECGFDILNAMFNKEYAKKINEQYCGFDMVVVRHVLEHIPDLDDFFESLDILLDEEKGLLFIEVPNFGEAIKYGDCSTIWEEHPNYFNYVVLKNLLSNKGYHIIDDAYYDYSGGSMCVLAQKQEIHNENSVFVDLHQYEKFQIRVNEYAQKLRNALKNVKNKGIKIFLYGTGARACTLVNGLGIQEIDYAIDDQIEKQGHYMPGSHLPIISFNEVIQKYRAGGVFLLAVNHENEKLVTDKILSEMNLEGSRIISLFAPNDIFEELEKLKNL